MSVSYRQEDDILKVFSSNRYVGYVDDSEMLYFFDRTRTAVPVKRIEMRADISAAYSNWWGF